MRRALTLVMFVLASALNGASANSGAVVRFNPIKVHLGINRIPNIAGDDKAGSIYVFWHKGHTAGSTFHTYSVSVGQLVVPYEESTQITDAPHVVEDTVRSVRFARRSDDGNSSLYMLIASRGVEETIPAPSKTTVAVYILAPAHNKSKTPYMFKLENKFDARIKYCNADVALKTELGLPLSGDYPDAKTANGCYSSRN